MVASDGSDLVLWWHDRRHCGLGPPMAAMWIRDNGRATMAVSYSAIYADEAEKRRGTRRSGNRGASSSDLAQTLAASRTWLAHPSVLISALDMDEAWVVLVSKGV